MKTILFCILGIMVVVVSAILCDKYAKHKLKEKNKDAFVGARTTIVGLSMIAISFVLEYAIH